MNIVLDSSPLGLLSDPKVSAEVVAITTWASDCLTAGHRFYVAEIIDYELRRELLRAGKTRSVARLDALKATFRYLPLDTPTMLLAADLWAQVRRTGLPTASPQRLDVDVILAAQALSLGLPTSDLIVATTNVGHLSRFVPADLWTNIAP